MVRLLVLLSCAILYMDGFALEIDRSFLDEVDYFEKNGSVIEVGAGVNPVIFPADNIVFDHNNGMFTGGKTDSYKREVTPFVFKIHGILLKNGTVKIKKNEVWSLSYLNQSGGVLDIEGKLILKIKDEMQQKGASVKSMHKLKLKGRVTPLNIQKKHPIDPLDRCVHFSHVIMHPDAEIIFPENLLEKMQSYFNNQKFFIYKKII